MAQPHDLPHPDPSAASLASVGATASARPGPAQPAAAAGAAAPVLRVQGLGFAYPDQAPLFTDWSVDLPAGITRVRGETGSGKSTLLQLLAGALAGRGRFTLAGQLLATDGAAYRAQRCCPNPRDPAWDALDAAAVLAALRRAHPGLDLAVWQRHLDGFSLGPHLAKPMFALSTGSRRKLLLAAALASGATLTLLDEPCAGLDAGSLDYLAQALADAARQPGRALVLASDHGLEALAAACTIDLPDPLADAGPA